MALAIVTGASAGLGRAIAQRLAAKGYDLLLVARGEEKLRQTAEELGRTGVRADILAADLATEEGVGLLETTIAACTDLDVLVNNAGFGTYGPLAELQPEAEVEQIRLNAEAVVRLTRAALPVLLARGKGTVLNVASTASFQPVPYFATYAATKAFVLSFSQSIAAEVKGKGVQVTAICPGPIATSFQERAGMTAATYGPLPWDKLDAVADGAVAAIGRGKPVVLFRMLNRLMVLFNNVVPNKMLMTFGELIFRPKPGSKAPAPKTPV